jgi:hypothetical protein
MTALLTGAKSLNASSRALTSSNIEFTGGSDKMP